MSLNKYASISPIFPTALLLWSTYRPHVTAHTSPKKKNNKLQLSFTMLLPYMCHLQICPSNATYALYVNFFMCIYETTVLVYMSRMNPVQSTIWPGELIYIISHYWHIYLNKYASHVQYMSH